jgi:hypothetical protein
MSTLAPRTSSTTDESGGESFTRAALEARGLLGGQVVITQSRCVDQVLDLFNLTDEPAVRAILSEFLSEIRCTSAVSGERFRRAIDLAVAASHVEVAYSGLLMR